VSWKWTASFSTGTTDIAASSIGTTVPGYRRKVETVQNLQKSTRLELENGNQAK